MSIKLSALPVETTFAATDYLVKVKSAAGGDVLVTMQNLLLAAGGKNYNPYKFSVYRGGAWTSGSSAFAKVNFDTEEYDTGNNFDSATNFRFVCPIAGFYQFNWNVDASVSGGSLFRTALYKNGSTFREGSGGVMGAATQGASSSGATIAQAAATDYFEVFFYGSGGAGGIGGGTAFSGFLVSAT